MKFIIDIDVAAGAGQLKAGHGTFTGGFEGYEEREEEEEGHGQGDPRFKLCGRGTSSQVCWLSVVSCSRQGCSRY